jgi:dCMP deaminase
MGIIDIMNKEYDMPEKSPGYHSIDKSLWMMGFAEQAAKRSPDEETKVGCALFNSFSGALLSIGFNGFIRGANDAKLPKVRPAKYQYMVHAEVNMIANCAKHGISMQDCELFCTLSPCISCMRNLWNCGIKRIYVKELYKDFNEIKNMEDLHVKVSRVGHYFVLEYCPYV